MARPLPLNRAAVVLLCGIGATPPAAPKAQAQGMIGSVGGWAGVAKSEWSRVAPSVRLDLMARWGPISAGPEVAYAWLGDTNRVSISGVAVRLRPASTAVSPLLVASLGRYSWKERGEAVLIGGGLGAGLSYRAGSRLELALEGRWHPTLQRIDPSRTLWTVECGTRWLW